MATRIRLARGGAKKRPYYRIVVSDSRSPRDGKFIEKVGVYHPMLGKDDPNRVQFQEERVKHWLGQGATPSERVENFLVAANLLTRNKRKQKLLDERIAKSQAIKKEKEAAEAAKKAEEEAKAAAEAKAAEEEAKKAEAEAAAAAKAAEEAAPADAAEEKPEA